MKSKQMFLNNESMMSNTISRMRFILLFGVLMIHSRLAVDCTVDWSTFNSGELYKLYMYTGSLVIPSFCVPTFFLISGYLFFYKVNSFDFSLYKNKLRKRVHSLLVPYIIFCIIASLAYMSMAAIGGGNIGTQIKEYARPSIFWNFFSSDGITTIWGIILKENYPTDAPLWYVRDLMVYCIMSPIIYMAAKHAKYIFMALLLLVNFTVLWPSCSLFYYGFVYFSIGALLSINKQTLLIGNRKLRLVVYMVTVMLLAIRASQICESQYGVELIKNAYIVFSTLSVFNLFGYNKEWKFPSRLTEPTFFVFATHQIMVIGIVHNNILPKVFLNSTNPVCHTAEYILTPFVTLFACSTAYYILKHLFPKVAAVLNGNR